MAAPQTAPSARATTDRPLEHKHPSGQVYFHACKACRAADATRSGVDKRTLSDDDLPHVTFLIPEDTYSNHVCRSYLLEKYPDAPFVGSSLDLAKLPGFPDDEVIVVVRRMPKPGKRLGARYERKKDAEEKWVTDQVEPARYFDEVVESEPLNIKRTMVLHKADRFTKSSTDIKPLIARLEELMFPWRPDLPRNKEDSVLRMVRSCG